MVDLVLLQSVSYVVAAIGVCVAAFYYIFNLRETSRNRKTAYTTNFMQQFCSKENSRRFIDLRKMNWTVFDDFEKKYDSLVNPFKLFFSVILSSKPKPSLSFLSSSFYSNSRIFFFLPSHRYTARALK